MSFAQKYQENISEDLNTAKYKPRDLIFSLDLNPIIFFLHTHVILYSRM